MPILCVGGVIQLRIVVLGARLCECALMPWFVGAYIFYMRCTQDIGI